MKAVKVLAALARRFLAIVFTTFVISSGGGQRAQAETTTIDAREAVAGLLKTYGSVSLTQHNYYQCNCSQQGPGCSTGIGNCRTVCHTCDNPKVNNGILQASNIRVVAFSSIVFDTRSQKTELPAKFVSSGYIYQNCSTKIPVTETENTSVSFQRGTSTTVTKTVSNTTGFSGQAQWKPLDTLQLTFGVNVGSSNTSAVAKLDSTQETVIRSHQVSAQLTPGVAFGTAVKTWPVNYTTEFHATVTVEADLSANDKGLRLLSQVADAPQRTFDVTGTIGFTDAADGVGVDWDAEYDQSRCPSNSDGVVKFPITLPTHDGKNIVEWKLDANE